MKTMIHRTSRSILLLFTIAFLLTACKKTIETMPAVQEQLSEAGKNPKSLKDFTQVNLVGNNNAFDPARIDPLLVNAWGIAFSPGGTIWISAQGTGVSTVYNKDGNQVLPAVQIPSPGGPSGGNPTGQVFNGSRGFRLANGNPARFIFVNLDGVISGWNGGPSASLVKNNNPDVYTGAAIARSGADSFLYVADFRDAEIETYDTAWNLVSMPFMDPSLPAGYAPFNVQTIDNMLYVMYAKQAIGPAEAGPGLGYVSIFNTDGSFVKRFVSNGQLNAPWGVAKAPASFWGAGGEPNMILIGNFGDGRINAYDADGNFHGQLRAHGNPIVIDKLWAISFAPATATTINPNWLYFAAGPNHELDGLFGYITKE